MKLEEIKTTDEYVEYSLYVDEKEDKIITDILEKNHITLNEFVATACQEALDHPIELFEYIKEHRSDKCGKGTPGNPIFKVGDKIGFYIKPYQYNREIFCKGTVEIVDRYGHWGSPDNEPSYDIMVENWCDTGEPMFVKHVEEHCCCTLKFED